MATKMIYFDGVEMECECVKDRNNEWVCENAATGRFVKFPNVSEAQLNTLITAHNETNSAEVVVAEE